MYYRTFNETMKERFGVKIYRIALDGGFTCPNRDGTKGTRGCIFCLNGSGDFAEKTGESITEQIEGAKKRIESKCKSGKYIAYFQSYTNTYAPFEKLRELFNAAINHPDVVMLSIATRPDCLPDETVELLKELNKIKPVIVELGLQTINPETATYIRRGYSLDVFDDAMRRLKNAGIETVVHMIVGLPGETAEDMVKTAEYIGKSGANGIKIQLLHVLRGTDLEKDYENGVFRALSLEEYTDIVMRCIRRLPIDVVIHRITGDGSKKNLVAPTWSADKKKVLNYMNNKFSENNLIQGSDL